MTLRNDNPLVTVILPVYNGADFVGCTLQSVMNQTYRNLEIVVVDDGSTDKTRAVLEAQAAGDPRVHLISQDNTGVARARNRAIAAREDRPEIHTRQFPCPPVYLHRLTAAKGFPTINPRRANSRRNGLICRTWLSPASRSR